jgi:hypothetical protein
LATGARRADFVAKSANFAGKRCTKWPAKRGIYSGRVEYLFYRAGSRGDGATGGGATAGVDAA